MNETISALMDGELKGAERELALRSASADNGARAAWTRYHLMGSALKNESFPALSPDFADRVAARIAAEPLVSEQRFNRFSRSLNQSYVGRFALAASVAAAALLGVQWFAPQQLASQPAAIADAHQVEGGRWDTAQREWEQDLNAFLVDHSQASPAAGMNGMISYTRIAGYDYSKPLQGE